MYELDGAAAGGQFVRTALSLSVLEGEPVRIENVRGNRSTPGLRHQHLAVLETLAELADADVAGDEVGAETVTFAPGRDRPAGGSYAVDVPTAGSVPLLFDAALPLATVLEEPLSLSVTGGTDVAWAPPADYFRRVKLPTLREAGLVATCEVERRGFYPDGGGRMTLHLSPSDLEPIDRADRGDLAGVRLYSIEAESLADRDVAHRQAEGALERLALEERGLDLLERTETTAASPSPGSAIVLRLDHAGGVAGFGALGERGKPAERVGEDAADALGNFLESGAAVDRHLGDQLLVSLALAGGRVRIPAVTDHVAASRDLFAAFGVEFALESRPDGEAVVSLASSPLR